MPDSSLYDDDIYAWSEQQAAALRRLASRADLPNELDLAHIAEEIEDVGHGELREAQSLLRRALAQLVVSWAAPDVAEPDDWRWTGNVINWLGEAELRLSPSMHGLVALGELWKRAVRQAIQQIDIAEDQSAAVRACKLQGTACPFTVDELVSDEFRISQALQKIAALAGSSVD